MRLNDLHTNLNEKIDIYSQQSVCFKLLYFYLTIVFYLVTRRMLWMMCFPWWRVMQTSVLSCIRPSRQCSPLSGTLKHYLNRYTLPALILLTKGNQVYGPSSLAGCQLKCP